MIRHAIQSDLFVSFGDSVRGWEVICHALDRVLPMPAGE